MADDVINLEKKRASKKRAQQSEGSNKGPKKAELYEAIAERMDDGELTIMPDAFPHKFFVVERELGVRHVLRLTNKDKREVEYSSIEAVQQSIAEYIRDHLQYIPEYAWERRHVNDCSQVWMMRTKPIPLPKPILWANTINDDYTFHRLPWDFNEAIKQPVDEIWQELLSRISNADAFMDFIGSLFFEESDKSQSLWCFGEGLNGKGSVARILERTFGPSAVGLQVPSKDNRFFTGQLLYKCLGIFPDCSDGSFLQTDIYKGITGNNKIPMEKKFKDAKDLYLPIKFMLCSNVLPDISGLTADQRRIIFCEFLPIDPKDRNPQYDEWLWQASGPFMARCVQNYWDRNPHHGEIKTETEAAEVIGSYAEEGFETLFESFFDDHKPPDPTGYDQDGKPLPYDRDKKFVLGTDFNLIMNGAGLKPKDQQEFRIWLKRRYKVEKKKVKREDGKSEWRYLHITKRSSR